MMNYESHFISVGSLPPPEGSEMATLPRDQIPPSNEDNMPESSEVCPLVGAPEPTPLPFNPLEAPATVDQSVSQSAVAPPAQKSAAAASLRSSLKMLRAQYRSTSWRDLCFITFIVLILLCGKALEQVAFYRWMEKFDAKKYNVKGKVTLLALSSGALGGSMFGLTLIFVLFTMPSLRFAFCCSSFAFLVRIGFIDAVRSVFHVYSDSYTPLGAAAIAQTTAPLFAALFVKVFIKDKRSYMNPWFMASLVLVVAGILITSVNDLKEGFNFPESKWWWTLIYFTAVVLTSLMNTFQGVYVFTFTYNPKFDDLYKKRLGISTETDSKEAQNGAEGTAVGQCGEEGGLNNNTACEDEETSTFAMRHLQQGSDESVKMIMLAISLLCRVAGVLAFIPLEGTQGWGECKSVEEAWEDLKTGGKCMGKCDGIITPFVMYILGFLLGYIGSAYLNHYSVIMCSIITQMSWPMVHLVWRIKEDWRPQKKQLLVAGRESPKLSKASLIYDIVGFLVLLVGSFVYALWESSTSEEREQGEQKKKEKMLNTTGR